MLQHSLKNYIIYKVKKIYNPQRITVPGKLDLATFSMSFDSGDKLLVVLQIDLIFLLFLIASFFLLTNLIFPTF